ncbi:MAG TPA: F0F1 ATP synthase subunit A [Chthoniobacterales bacterium]|jgi:F-type H+-transporting ATPase subunit a
MFRYCYSRLSLAGLAACFICAVVSPALAAETEETSQATHGGVSITAEAAFPTARYLTNSIVVALLCTLLLLVLSRKATRHMQLVPRGTQNLFEALVEGLYEMLEGIVGKHMIVRTFALLATIFIYILTTNWFGLLPGVGTIGFGVKSGPLALSEVTNPLLRPASADLNMTLAIAGLFMCMWLYWTFTVTGPFAYFKELFGPKGGVTGFLKIVLIPIFFFVGIIEVISISFRLVSLSMRLYGNMFAGENLLHTMSTLGDKLPLPLAYLSSIVLPLPFYFLELLVGLIQALVFMLLCSVYIQLSTTHEAEGEH